MYCTSLPGGLIPPNQRKFEIKSEKEEAVEMSTKKEVSIIELRDNGKRFKVTKRVPGLLISDTKLFETKEEALKQFEEWLE